MNQKTKLSIIVIIATLVSIVAIYSAGKALIVGYDVNNNDISEDPYAGLYDSSQYEQVMSLPGQEGDYMFPASDGNYVDNYGNLFDLNNSYNDNPNQDNELSNYPTIEDYNYTQVDAIGDYSYLESNESSYTAELNSETLLFDVTNDSIVYGETNNPIVEFEYNNSAIPNDFSIDNLTIIRGVVDDNSFVIVNQDINSGATETIYIHAKENDNAVCIKDAEVTNPEEITQGCTPLGCINENEDTPNGGSSVLTGYDISNLSTVNGDVGPIGYTAYLAAKGIGYTCKIVARTITAVDTRSQNETVIGAIKNSFDEPKVFAVTGLKHSGVIAYQAHVVKVIPKNASLSNISRSTNKSNWQAYAVIALVFALIFVIILAVTRFRDKKVQ
jgi:hypothetical protein